MSSPVAHLPSNALRSLGTVSQQYSRMANEYAAVATTAAQSEAAHKTARAKHMLTSRDSGECRSVAEAEIRAEADDTIAGLFQQRLITRALADSHLEKLRQLRTQVEVGRSYVASEREADRLTDQRHP